MITRRDAIRLAVLAAAGPALLSACGGDGSGGGDGPPLGADDLALVDSGAERATADPATIPDVTSALHGFAGDLYAALPADGNLVLSPYSISVALGLTLAGAEGTTENEMRSVLGADDDFHAGMNALTAHVAGLAGERQRDDGKKVEIALAPANQLFGQHGVAWEQEFLDLLAEQYGAGVRTVDFEGATGKARTLINDWVASRTDDKITDLVPADALSTMTRLVLVNALHLRAPWDVPFEKGFTERGRFHRADGSTVAADLMVGPMTAARLTGGDGWRAAQIPYAGGELAMTVVLPDEGRLADVDRAIADGVLTRMLAGGEETALELVLPRWTSRTAVPLAAVLKGLGMPAAFDRSGADFGPMTEDDLTLFIDDVLHQGYVSVDERGTEAAAATGVAMMETSAPITEPFHADRPFVYVIHDVEHATPLFLGRVTDPTA